MPVTVTVCSTCKIDPAAAFDAAGRTGGEILARALEDAAAARAGRVRIRRHECLWACRNSCAVLVQEPGKTGYLAGRFEAGAAAAEAILEWAQAYADSADGAVAYGRWPNGMKGHFVARIPASGETER